MAPKKGPYRGKSGSLIVRYQGKLCQLNDLIKAHNMPGGVIRRRYARMGQPIEIDAIFDKLFGPVLEKKAERWLTLLPDGTQHSVPELAKMFGVPTSTLHGRVTKIGQVEFTRDELRLMSKGIREKKPVQDLKHLSSEKNTGAARDPDWEFYTNSSLRRNASCALASINW